MSPTSPQRGTSSTQESRLAPSGRTFARRIDCADSGQRRSSPAPARGGGNRHPEGWEHPSRRD
jgi:hypothetical protein